MPSFGPRCLRNMSPCARVSKVEAASARMRGIPADNSKIGNCANATLAAINAAAPRNAGIFFLTFDAWSVKIKRQGTEPSLPWSRRETTYFFISSFLASFLAVFLAFLSAFLSPFFISDFLSYFIGWAPAWDAGRAAPLETADTLATRVAVSILMR